MSGPGRRLARLVSKPAPQLAPDHDDRYFEKGFESTRRYLSRFDGNLDFAGKEVLDVGCGYGTTCFALAEGGAARVVGIDVSEYFIDFARAKLRDAYPQLAERMEFRHVTQAGDPTGDKFDRVISKDSFEHIADPESYLGTMKGYLKPGGLLGIGFSPLWNSPYGAHIKDQTRLPWVHKLLPERAVLEERAALGYPDGGGRYEDVAGGLNRMTLKRFLTITSDPQLEQVYLATNATQNRLGKVLRAASRVPGAREFCTFNVYGVWRLLPTL